MNIANAFEVKVMPRRGIEYIMKMAPKFLPIYYLCEINNSDHINLIIESLEKVQKGEISEYEWGHEMAWITSSRSESIAKLESNKLIQNIPTSEFLKLMTDWNDFLNTWKSKTKIMPELKRAFNQIKENINSLQGPHYGVKDSDEKTIITIVLVEEDFKLIADEFILQVETKNSRKLK